MSSDDFDRTPPAGRPGHADPVAPEPAGERRPFGAGLILSGSAIIAVFLGGFTAWSLLAPIESAVVAPGVVGTDTNRKTIQHLEGGIIERIFVREGDSVSAGDVLIRLQNTVPVSVLNQLQGQYMEARATEARLVAERDGSPEIVFPDELTARTDDPSVAAVMAGQRSIFEHRRDLLRERLAILDRNIAGLKDEIGGLQGQVQSAKIQRTLIDEELEGVSSLFRKKLINKPRLLSLQRRKAEIAGALSQYRATIARSRQDIEQARLRQTELRASRVTEVAEQLRAVGARAYDLGQRLAAARDVLRRIEIRSPIDGVVIGVKVHTVGGVISAGQPLLDIVPINEKLVVHAAIDPLDIDQVRVGLPATVRLTALNVRSQTPIEGRLKTVSADRLVDPKTGYAYYLGRVELDAASPGFSAVTLQPGMSADVMIRTGDRTPWEYMLAPITRVMDRAMREE